MSEPLPPPPSLLSDVSGRAIGAGIVASIVGYVSTFAIIVQALTAAGATTGQVASGLLAMGIAQFIASIILCTTTRIPVSIAWSTPGLALLISNGAMPGGFAEVVGGFVICGALIILCGLWTTLDRLVRAIPPTLANAMLAGVLLKLCLKPFSAVGISPVEALAVVGTWVVVGRFWKLWAVPAALAVATAIIVVESPGSILSGAALVPELDFVTPVFTLSGLVSVGLPLFLVTMASQNIPGLAILSVYGYQPKTAPVFVTTGIGSLVTGLFGAIPINLAAITAAMCASPEAHPDPTRRWVAALTSGVGYLGFGLIAGIATAFVANAPTLLIAAVAGLALLNACGAALVSALTDQRERLAALVTFMVAATDLTFFGVGSAFWSLIAGGAVYVLYRRAP